jgi:hypothetical protein
MSGRSGPLGSKGLNVLGLNVPHPEKNVKKCENNVEKM